MSKVLNTEYPNELAFFLDYVVDAEEYKVWKNRILEQLRTSYRHEGFRPGHVPMEIFLKNADPEKIKEILLKETVEKYSYEAIEKGKQKLKDDGRIHIEIGVVSDPNLTKENEDGSFQFRVFFGLLPQIDIEPIRNLQLQEPTEADLPKRLSLEEFIQREERNLLEAVNKNRDKESPFTTIEEAIQNTSELKQQFTDRNGLKAFLEKTYNGETTLLFEDAKRAKIVQAILNLVPTFPLPEDRVNSEVLRIVQVIVSESEKRNKTLAQVVGEVGIPNPDNLPIKNVSDLTAIVQKYVENEFRLRWGILRYVYEKYAEEKITEEEVEKAAEEIQNNPQAYGLPRNLNQEEYKNLAYDYLIRVVASRIIESWVVWTKPEQTQKQDADGADRKNSVETNSVETKETEQEKLEKKPKKEEKIKQTDQEQETDQEDTKSEETQDLSQIEENSKQQPEEEPKKEEEKDKNRKEK